MKRASMLSLALGAFAAVLVGSPATSGARVDVSIGINVPPPGPFIMSAPPEVVVIPGTYVYFIPTLGVDVFFYHGYWYRPHYGHWYRASTYNGHWVLLDTHRVPDVLVRLPGDFRRLPPGNRHIPYREFHNNWRTWENNRYWEKHDFWRHREAERREDYRERREDHRERKEDYRERKDYHYDKGGGKGRK